MFIKTISKVIHLTDKIEHLYLPSMSNKINQINDLFYNEFDLFLCYFVD